MSASCLLAVAGFAQAQEDAAALPLTLVERSPTDPPPSAFEDSTNWVRYVYRNDGDKAITAWNFRCIVAMNDGRTGWIGKPTDIFSMFMIHPVAEVQDRIDSDLLEPGETVEESIGHGSFEPDGPYAVQTCGPTAVIFVDGSYAGAPELLEEFFVRRRALVGKVHYLLQRLDDRVERFSNEHPGALEVTLAAADELGGFYRPHIDALRSPGKGNAERLKALQALRQVVAEDYSRALRHLRPIDRKLLEGGQP